MIFPDLTYAVHLKLHCQCVASVFSGPVMFSLNKTGLVKQVVQQDPFLIEGILPDIV